MSNQEREDLRSGLPSPPTAEDTRFTAPAPADADATRFTDSPDADPTRFSEPPPGTSPTPRDWKAGRLDPAEGLLDGTALELRCWEWHFLKRLLHADLAASRCCS